MSNRFLIHSKVIFGLCTVALLFVACVNEDLTTCVRPVSIIVKTAVVVDGEVIAPDAVKDGLLYVFDKDENYLGEHALSRANIVNQEPIPLNYPRQSILNVVIWANHTSQVQDYYQFKVGDHISKGFISATEATTRSLQNTIVTTPDDLFHGMRTINIVNQKDITATVELSRRMGGLTITTKGLKRFTETTDEDFSYFISETYGSMNFIGNLIGPMVNYLPQAGFVDNQDTFVAPQFNIFPSGDTDRIAIMIYKAGVLVHTVDKDTQGNPIKSVRGKVIDMTIDFTTSEIDVSIDIVPWGTVDQTTDF